eukprot:m.358434 g.358434  ORF g.358434 m.358434 type:complete len:287 (+) comp18144_c0_seq1:50-910(+)
MSFGFAGGDGGGFMTTGGEFASPSSQGPATGEQKRLATTTPVNIFQIKEATKGAADNSYLINGTEIDKVQFVGVIQKVEEAQTRTTFTIEDHTGRIEATQWKNTVEGEEEPAVDPSLRELSHVIVFGAIQSKSDADRRVNAFHIAPVRDFNQITHHMLNCIHAMLTSQRGIKAPRVLGIHASANAAATTSANAPAGVEVKVNASEYGQAAVGGMDVDGSMSTDANQVHRYIISAGASEDMGVNVDAITSALPALPPQKIRAALEELLEEGIIYTTIDEAHFKSTEE